MSISYQYNAKGYYSGAVEDYGILPSNATRTSPSIEEGFVSRWNGEKWELVENHVGMEGYVNGEPFTIKDFGSLPDGWSLEKPAPTDEEIAKNRIEAIDREIEALEKKAIRPILAMQAGTSQDIDIEIAKEIEFKINELRCERQILEFV